MSFKISWDSIEKQSFSSYTTELLNEALNSGKRPNILSSDIKIVDLKFGHIAPEFEILEIGDLGPDRFRGIFKFKYDGDAYITVKTKVSASPLRIYNDNILDDLLEKNKSSRVECENLAGFIKPNFIMSDSDFDIPLNLTLSKFKLSSIIIIVFSKSKGLTLVFKNDPLESIEVSSTFDRIKPIAKFLQKTIVTQISELFKEFLPSYLYKLSLRYTTQSLDQFHRDLLNEEQDNAEKRVLLKDLDPESPLRISPGSLMRLTRLSSSRQTLALGGLLSCDRMNDDVVTKTFANAILASNNTLNWNKIQLSNADFHVGSMHSKLSIIRDFQTRSFLKNSSDGAKPLRRKIKIKRSRASETKKEETVTESSTVSVSDSSTIAVSPLEESSPAPSRLASRSISSPPLSSSSTYGSESVDPLAGAELNKNRVPGKLFMGISEPDSNNMKKAYLNNLHLKLATKKSDTVGPAAYSISQPAMLKNAANNVTGSNSDCHIDKYEQLKIQSRRFKLDKLLANANPNYSPAAVYSQNSFMDSPPPYSL